MRAGAGQRSRQVLSAALALLLVVGACAPPRDAGTAPGTPPTGSSPSEAAEAASHTPSPAGSATPRPTFPEDDFTRLVRDVAGSAAGEQGELNALWRRILAAEGVDDYTGPSALVAYRGGEEIPASACSPGTGIAFWRQNARYCPSDESVLFDEIWLRDFAGRAGAFAPAAILAHEWGHHVQNLLATRGFSIQLELQADCFAGMYLGTTEQVSDGAYEIRVEELASGLETFFSIGNRDYAEDSWFQAYEHGSRNQRLVAFGTGYLAALGELGGFGELVNGYPWCAGYAEFEAGEMTEVGPYGLLNPPGRTETATAQSYEILPATQSRQPTSGITLRWLSELPLPATATALEQLGAVLDEALPGTMLLYDPLAMDVAGARATAHYFERSGANTAAAVESGLVYLQLPDELSGGLLLVVHRPQPAARDPLTREKLATLAEHMVTLHQVINRLCAPYERDAPAGDVSTVVCLPEQ